jgi:methenyltetrahydrofolate cyclohydrolase
MAIMKSVWQQTLKDIRETTASTRPFATSGSLSLIMAVYGCSLARMAISLSIQAGASQRRLQAMETINHRLSEASERLEALADRDVGAFQGYLAALRLPDNRADQKKRRAALISLRRIETVRVPLQGTEEILKLYPLIEQFLPWCKKSLVSDLAVASNMLNSSVVNLAWSILVNAQKLTGDSKVKIKSAAGKTVRASSSAAKAINRKVAVRVQK